jgi:membrane-associated phospholipid phosphatase
MKPIWIIGIIIAGGLAACALDMSAYHFVDSHIEPHRYERTQIVQGFEDFAQTIPPLAIIAAIWLMDRRHGRQIVIRMFLAFVMVAPVTHIGKSLVGRYRPEYFQGQTWRDTWIDVGWHHRDNKHQSFFSGHSGAAFTIAVGLSAYYPPLRPLAYILATGCALSRVATENHWLSDVYLGSLSGMALGWLFLPGRLRRVRREKGLLQGKLTGQPVGVS